MRHEWNNFREGTGKGIGTFIVILINETLVYVFYSQYFNFLALLVFMTEHTLSCREQSCPGKVNQ